MTAVKISVPYIGIDSDGPTREWAHMTFRRDDAKVPCRRQIKRVMRKYLNAALGRRVHTRELEMLVNRKRWSFA
ncbi:hypothetical protein [Nostoc phage NMeng1]|nr:hypothetical protein [Nostoc phage NMeng1]